MNKNLADNIVTLIPGLSRIGNVCLIPKDAEKPIDQRTKNARRKK